MAHFEALGLQEVLLKNIEKEGFSEPTEIQAQAIMPLMGGKDLMGIAHTGGGKTAAFILPIIHNLIETYERPMQNKPKVLILAPTRELAIQIGSCADIFSRGTKLRTLVVAGGQPYPPQTKALSRGVDILVATPGRLIDHAQRRTVQFQDTSVFILDEADRMLDMGFIEDVEDIAAELKEGHQTILFSATMNAKVQKLSRRLLTDPVKVEIKQETAVAKTINHKLMNVTRRNKSKLLIQVLQGENVEKALVFSRTKRGADELSDMLYEAGIRSDAIHGDKKQRVREKILMNFKRGRTAVLVATDVAARGIDVDGISHVINYELPIEPENYIHRVGRTGRAGASGIAVSFCDPSDIRLLRNIEDLIKMKIEVDEEHEFHIALANGAHSMKRGSGRDFSERGRSDRGRRSSRDDRSRGFGGRNAGGQNTGGQNDNDRNQSRGRDRDTYSPRSGGYSKDFSYSDDTSPAERTSQENKWSKQDNTRSERSSRSERPTRFENNDRKDRGGNDRNIKDSRPSRRAERSDRNDRASFPNYDDRRSSQKRQKTSKNTNRYDHWNEAKKFKGDPVLEKLIGKPPVIKAKKSTKDSFAKPADQKSSKAKKRTLESRRQNENDTGMRKERGGKKTLSAKGSFTKPSSKNNSFSDGKGARSPGKKLLGKKNIGKSKNTRSNAKSHKNKPVAGNKPFAPKRNKRAA